MAMSICSPAGISSSEIVGKMDQQRYIVKVSIVGDPQVGKSAILAQFCDNRFRSEYEATIGVEYGSRMLSLQEISLKLQVWDTAGREEFRSITRCYFNAVAGVFIVYSVGKSETFEGIQQWLKEVRTNSSPEAIIVLVGNQTDEPRQVSTEEGQKFANDNGIFFMETSAKDSGQVNALFEMFAWVVVGKLKSEGVSVGAEYGIRDA